MAYEALYTKARPKNLAQLIGQEHIAITLTNAINQDRMSHAYLLVGTRGTGKTSTARILAKAINCDAVHEAKETKTAIAMNKIPCNDCEACKNFKSSTDNVEFDAASNRSVEDVSRLLSTSYLAPMHSRFKTFIIDEVHMLTFEAVNSILKIIEEPPPNVVFLLATTEFNKVPMTIRSRCQILNFKLIPAELTAQYLSKISARLNLTIDDDALIKIARLSKGSMRDAMTFLDQCYSMADTGHLTLEMVDNTLGLLSDADLDNIINSAASKNRSQLIKDVAKVFKSGLTADNIAESLITRLRDKVTIIVNASSQELALYNEMIDKLRQSVIEMQNSGIPEIILETTLFKFASTTPLPDTKKNFNNNEQSDFEIKTDLSSVSNMSNVSNNIEIPIKTAAPNKDVDVSETIMTFNDKFKDSEIFNTANEKKSEWPIELVGTNRPEVGGELLNKLNQFFATNNETEITYCIKQTTVIQFVYDTITVNINNPHYNFLFKEHIKRMEEVLQTKTGEYINIEILNDDDGFEDVTLSMIAKKINSLPPEEKEYTQYFMKLLQVNYEDIQVVSEEL